MSSLLANEASKLISTNKNNACIDENDGDEYNQDDTNTLYSILFWEYNAKVSDDANSLIKWSNRMMQMHNKSVESVTNKIENMLKNFFCNHADASAIATQVAICLRNEGFEGGSKIEENVIANGAFQNITDHVSHVLLPRQDTASVANERQPKHSAVSNTNDRNLSTKESSSNFLPTLPSVEVILNISPDNHVDEMQSKKHGKHDANLMKNELYKAELQVSKEVRSTQIHPLEFSLLIPSRTNSRNQPKLVSPTDISKSKLSNGLKQLSSTDEKYANQFNQQKPLNLTDNISSKNIIVKHSNNERRNILFPTAPYCKFAGLKTCKYGKFGHGCPYSHEPDHPDRLRAMSSFSDIPCKNYFNEGQCRFGSRCFFSHDTVNCDNHRSEFIQMHHTGLTNSRYKTRWNCDVSNHDQFENHQGSHNLSPTEVSRYDEHNTPRNCNQDNTLNDSSMNKSIENSCCKAKLSIIYDTEKETVEPKRNDQKETHLLMSLLSTSKQKQGFNTSNSKMNSHTTSKKSLKKVTFLLQDNRGKIDKHSKNSRRTSKLKRDKIRKPLKSMSAEIVPESKQGLTGQCIKTSEHRQPLKKRKSISGESLDKIFAWLM
mmetsp:Transcript_25946/g.29665  ORF Transcript_25946/g.29665 Transcript_25946/m.29665 type:complete len:602 (-) Transcript_25946:220-2025(-)